MDIEYERREAAGAGEDEEVDVAPDLSLSSILLVMRMYSPAAICGSSLLLLFLRLVVTGACLKTYKCAER